MKTSPHIFFFLHPVVFGNAEGNFFKVLMEINPKADDSMKEESKPISSEIKTFFFPIISLISFIRVKFLTPPPEKIQKSIFFLVQFPLYILILPLSM